MLRRKEVFQTPSEFGFRKIVEISDLDPDLCEMILAMMARPGTNLEDRSRATRTGLGPQGQVSGHKDGSGTMRRSSHEWEPLRRFHKPPKTLVTFLSLSLFTFLLPGLDERTSSKLESC